MPDDYPEDDAPEFDPESSGLDGKSVPIASLEMLRDHALICFDKISGSLGKLDLPPVDITDTDVWKHRRNFLSVAETELIVREHCSFENDAGFAVGGDTPEEALQKMNELMGALISRVMSNVIRCGVDAGFIDVAFDNDDNDFHFSITESGQQLVDNLKEQFGGEDAE